MRELIAQSTGEPGALRPHVDFGDAAKVVLARERTLGPDLVVIGKRTRGLLADFFLGGVTQRVLAATRSDVLVLPVASEQGRSAAMEWGVRAT